MILIFLSLFFIFIFHSDFLMGNFSVVPTQCDTDCCSLYFFEQTAPCVQFYVKVLSSIINSILGSSTYLLGGF